MNNLTQQRGAVPLTLDRPRLVFFDMAATWWLVDRYGLDFVSELYSVKTEPLLIDVTTQDLAAIRTPLKTPKTTLALKSMEALAFFLWAGLQADLLPGEELTLETVTGFIVPSTIRPIFYALIQALTFALSAPEPEPQPGKAEAARPAAKRSARKQPSKAAASTSPKRSGSRSPR